MKKSKQCVIFTLILCSIVFLGSFYNTEASQGREFVDSSGNFKAVVNSDGISPTTIKFVPLKDNMGEGFCYIQKYVNGSFAGSYPCEPNKPYHVNNVKKGDKFRFDFKYTLPNGYQAFSDSFEFEVGNVGGGNPTDPGEEGLAKFEPEDGKTLVIIGQDKQSMDDYEAIQGLENPAGYMFYTGTIFAEGFDRPSNGEDTDKGEEHDFKHLKAKPGENIIQVGLFMRGLNGEHTDIESNKIINGERDNNIRKIAREIKNCGKPVFLRIGYEFDGPWNGYKPELYIKAYRRIVDIFREMNVDNVAYVWHSAGIETRSYNASLQDYYPGDEYVDWVGVSWFQWGYSKAVPNPAINEMAEFAKAHDKPLMIAEAAPKQYWEPSKGQAAVDNWYKPVFDWIEEKDVKAYSYINQNWMQWPRWNSGNGQDWGDTRIQNNSVVLNYWKNVMEKPRYINSPDDLYKQIGFVKGNTTNPIDITDPGDATDPSFLTPPAEPAPYVEPTTTVDDTPIHNSNEFYSDSKSGLTMIREGKVIRVDDWLWKGDFLAPFRQTRGYVKPSSVEGLLSNPHRADGLALNAGYYVPSHFTGHIPVFTEGNWWPNVGKYQTGPLMYNSDFQDDCGIYFVNGKPVNTKEPLLVNGFEGAKVTNKTKYSILVTAGSFPGNEQSGQVMTPLNPNDTKSLPMPPKGWYTEGAVPELYASVAGIHPFDVVGWHKSRPKDFGTPGFAYVIDGRYDLGTKMMWFGFRKNEGYDPATSGDPGYGMAMYIDDELVAVTDMQLTGNGDTAKQDLWAVSRFNPGICPQGGLMAGPVAREGQKVVYEFISHEEAQRLLSTKSGVLHADIGSPQH